MFTNIHIVLSEMRNYINDTEILERELLYVPTTKEQMERLSFEYADTDDTFHQFSIMAPSGVAPEISDLFTSATNLFDDLPQVDYGDEDLGQPISPEPFHLPDDIGYDEPHNMPDMPDMPFNDFGGDRSLSPPDSPEVGRKATSFETNEPFPGAGEGDSRFSVGGDVIPASSTSMDGPEELVPHQSFSKRTSVMHKFLEKSFKNDDEELVYQDLVRNKKRSTVAQTFFECLVLKSRNVIDLHQEQPYGDIIISKTDSFAVLTK